MGTGSLVFSQAPALNGALVFGDDGAPAVPDVTLNAAGRITGLRGAVKLRIGVTARITGKITGLRGAMGAIYDNNVARPTIGKVAARWQDAAHASNQVQGKYQQSAPLTSGYQTRWQDATRLHKSTRINWQITLPLRSEVATRWQDAARRHLARRTHWQTALAMRQSVGSRWQDADRLRQSSIQRFQEALRDRRLSIGTRWQDALRQLIGVQSAEGYGLQMLHSHSTRWQDAWVPRPGTSAAPQPPLPEPCYIPSPRLVFSATWSADASLVFICERHTPPTPGVTVVVPVRKVYLVINDVSLRRVDGNIPLPSTSLSLSLDVDSWTWSFSAALPGRTLADLEPGSNGAPAELEAMVNGTAFRVLVESISRERTFGRNDIRVQGRGKTALLDSPYAPARNFSSAVPLTAQQIMADVLTVNNVPMPWTVDWHLIDWLVPGNVWAHQGSYISALNAIAKAAGGYIQPHASLQTLHILPRYPVAPWHWAAQVTPDFELPSDVTVREGIEWVEKPRYDRVYVSGQQQGVLGQVTRAGTAGDLLAPMLTDALITHADAARQRGISVLSDVGRQANLSLSLPVLPETGIITPGKFVRYVDAGVNRLGIVRSTSVEAGFPVVRQTLGVQTYA